MKIRSTAAVIAAITAAAMITACGAKKPKAGSPADAANTARTVAEDVVAAGSGGGGISADADAEKNGPDAGTVWRRQRG